MNVRRAAPAVIAALDVEERERALALVRELAPAISWFKIGSRLFTAEGPAIVEEARTLGASVFLDLKFHDIPQTVAGSVRAASALGVSMMTIHASGGVEMMRAAARAAAEESARLGVPRPLVVGVTMLTSLSAEDLARLFGTAGSARDQVLRLAALAGEAGIDGIVASVEEAQAVKSMLGDSFVVVTPGIRPAGAEAGDQKRIATPRAAWEAGSDFLVVGRPIIAAPSPVEAARAILRELTEAPAA
jgi:orotidine-5'-phosphate decarboxylase